MQRALLGHVFDDLHVVDVASHAYLVGPTGIQVQARLDSEFAASFIQPRRLTSQPVVSIPWAKHQIPPDI
jgi:hypothetical protein